MDKKKSKKKPPTNTADIRSFFSDRSPTKNANDNQRTPVKQPTRIQTSSDDESPVKKPNKKSSKKNNKEEEKMPPKRKKAILIDSSESDEEVIRVTKRSKKPSPKARKSTSDDDFVPSSKSSKSKKRKALDSDEDDFVPSSKSSKSKKRKAVDSDEDDFVPSPKAKKSTTKKTATTKTATKKSTGKTTSKSKGKTTKGSRNKIVKPLDYESSDNEDHVDCTMVNKKANLKAGFQSHNADLLKTAGDKNKLGEMWVDKYRPKKVGEIIGQHTPKCSANKLKNWLVKWDDNKHLKPNPFKNDTGAGLRAALLSGPPGIGKTTTAQLVAKECGYDYVEFNASDTRNKKSMDEQIKTLLNNKSLASYVQDPTNRTEMTTKHLLIMDEVDGMGGNADRGGIAELIQFIRKTQIPIICICNDRNNQKIRNLANYCFDLRFTKPKTEHIQKLINQICARESVKISADLLNEIIEMSNKDIRQVIHYFSVFATKTKTLSDVKTNKIIKNVSLGLFDATHKMFTAGAEYEAMSFRDKQDLFFNDYQLLPLMAFENYHMCRPTESKDGGETLARAAKSIDAMCIGDIISTEIRTNQTWHLLPVQACFATVMPGYYMNGHFNNKIEFAGWLGKLSSTNKKDRLINELKQHMNLKITGSKTCLNLDYILPLRERIIRPLLKKEEDAIPNAIKTLSHYCLLKDDLDSVIELSLWNGEKNPYAAVETKTKSALTRNYNNAYNPLPFVTKDMYKKVGEKAKKGKKDDDEDDEEEKEPDAVDVLLPEF